jgi:hypothetical protein
MVEIGVIHGMSALHEPREAIIRLLKKLAAAGRMFRETTLYERTVLLQGFG